VLPLSGQKKETGKLFPAPPYPLSIFLVKDPNHYCPQEYEDETYGKKLKLPYHGHLLYVPGRIKVCLMKNTLSKQEIAMHRKIHRH
jgi:hypothetical protein